MVKIVLELIKLLQYAVLVWCVLQPAVPTLSLHLVYPQLSVNHISVLSGKQWNVLETTEILRGDTLDMQNAFPVVCLLKIVFFPQ